MKTKLFIIFSIQFFYCCNVSDGDLFPFYTDYSEIYAITPNSETPVQLTNDKKTIFAMKYLPYSDQILFCNDDGTYIMESGGSNRRLLTKSSISLNNYEKSYLVVSSDESKAFYIKPDGIYSIVFSTSEEKLILSDTNYINELSLSHDGLQIIYCSHDFSINKSSLIYFNLFSQEKRILKEGIAVGFHYYYPQFTNDDKNVLYFEQRSNKNDYANLTILNLNDNSNITVLTTAHNNSIYPLSLNSKDDIFYFKDNLTITNLSSLSNIIIPATNPIPTIYSGMSFNWSIDNIMIVAAGDYSIQIINIITKDIVITQPNPPSQKNISLRGFKFPCLDKNNKKIFYVVNSTEERWG